MVEESIEAPVAEEPTLDEEVEASSPAAPGEIPVAAADAEELPAASVAGDERKRKQKTKRARVDDAGKNKAPKNQVRPDKTRPAKAARGTGKDERPSPVREWLVLVGETIVGLAVGVGLFWGFTELWKWNVYFALILAIVVIFAMVTFSQLVRHRRDLPTTLLALGVGLVVTIGPLVLLAA